MADAGAPRGADERLLVAIRPRPLAGGDAPDAGLKLSAGCVELVGEGALPFDRVFLADAGNGAVYADVAAPIVAAVLRGVNGAVAAYGQTGSGKTRTMRGTPDDPGLVQRAVRARRARGASGPRGRCSAAQRSDSPRVRPLALSCAAPAPPRAACHAPARTTATHATRMRP
jgi:hypothetical protein